MLRFVSPSLIYVFFVSEVEIEVNSKKSSTESRPKWIRGSRAPGSGSYSGEPPESPEAEAKHPKGSPTPAEVHRIVVFCRNSTISRRGEGKEASDARRLYPRRLSPAGHQGASFEYPSKLCRALLRLVGGPAIEKTCTTQSRNKRESG